MTTVRWFFRWTIQRNIAKLSWKHSGQIEQTRFDQNCRLRASRHSMETPAKTCHGNTATERQDHRKTMCFNSTGFEREMSRGHHERLSLSLHLLDCLPLCIRDVYCAMCFYEAGQGRGRVLLPDISLVGLGLSKADHVVTTTLPFCLLVCTAHAGRAHSAPCHYTCR